MKKCKQTWHGHDLICFQQYILLCSCKKIKMSQHLFWNCRLDGYLQFHFLHQHPSKWHECGVVENYCGRQLNEKWRMRQEVGTQLSFGLPHGTRRSRNNKWYSRTKFVFHGISVGNFCWRNNVRAASTNLNLYHVFIIMLLSVWFGPWVSWDSQVKTFLWLMKLRKNQRKIVECLPFQASLPCCQE